MSYRSTTQEHTHCAHRVQGCNIATSSVSMIAICHIWLQPCVVVAGPLVLSRLKTERVDNRPTHASDSPPTLELVPSFNGWLRLTQPTCLTPEPLTHESRPDSLLSLLREGDAITQPSL